jgi:hypothetical protein
LLVALMAMGVREGEEEEEEEGGNMGRGR